MPPEGSRHIAAEGVQRSAWQLLESGRVPEHGSFNMMATGVSVRQPLTGRIFPNRRFRV